MRDLVDLLIEAKQEVPPWIESIAYEARSMGGSRRPQNKRYELFLVILCRNELNGPWSLKVVFFWPVS